MKQPRDQQNIIFALIKNLSMMFRDSIVWPKPREFTMRQKTISRFHPNDINFVNEDLFVVRGHL